MSKTIKIVSVTLIFILLFTACVKTNTNSTPAKETTTTEETTVPPTTETTTTTSSTTESDTIQVTTTEEETVITTEETTYTTTKPITTTEVRTTKAIETTKKDMPTFDGPSADELRVLDLVNEEREKAGVHKLSFNYKLYNCAKYRATETVTNLSHTRPDGSRFSTILQDYGIPVKKCLGENICYRFSDVGIAVDTLMGSPLHKENILREDFSSMAVGIIPLENGTFTMVQLFEG